MNNEEISRILNETSLFAGTAPETLRRLGEIAEVRECAAGETIYEAGGAAPDMYVLVRGLVSFTMGSNVGLANVERPMKRHMIFGWAALVPEQPRRLGTAKCLEASTMLTLNGDKVMEVLRNDDPKSGLMIMTRLCSMIANSFIEGR